METRIVLETLSRRMRNTKLDEYKEIERHRKAANRGPAVLPLVFAAVNGSAGLT